MQPFLYFVSGVAAALAATTCIHPLRRDSLQITGLRLWIAGAILLLPLLTMALISGQATSPDTSLEEPGSRAGWPQPRASDDPDWEMISHAYLGGPPPGSASTPDAANDIAQLAATAGREPRNAAAWFALAQAQRATRDFPGAVTAYEHALKLEPANADGWADYADALASANNRRLAGEPAKAIAQALRLQPDHLKGLWLAASLDLEEYRYDAALKRWQHLRSVLPPGSPDAPIIDANIAEARQLAGSSAASAPAP